MKKAFKTVVIVAIAAIATYGGYSAYHQSKKNSKLSDLALENIEALARYELPEVEIVCSSGSSGQCFYCYEEFCGFYFEGEHTHQHYECASYFSGYSSDYCSCASSPC